MASKSKNKGNYHERWFLKLFQSLGLRIKKQPLSGSLGGEYKGDLLWIEMLRCVKERLEIHDIVL